MKKPLYTENEIAKLLGVSSITVQRWEHQGKIPYKIIAGAPRFNRNEIIRWAQEHDFSILQPQNKPNSSGSNTHFLSDAIARGGSYYNIPGKDVYSILNHSLETLPFLKNADKSLLLNELLDREELASTGIGNGIAIPHTRNRLDLQLEEAHLPLLYPQTPVPYKSIDNQPVFALFMIFSATTREHLKILSKISFVLQNESIIASLQERKPAEELLEEIRALESAAE